MHLPQYPHHAQPAAGVAHGKQLCALVTVDFAAQQPLHGHPPTPHCQRPEKPMFTGTTQVFLGELRNSYWLEVYSGGSAASWQPGPSEPCVAALKPQSTALGPLGQLPSLPSQTTAAEGQTL